MDVQYVTISIFSNQNNIVMLDYYCEVCEQEHTPVPQAIGWSKLAIRLLPLSSVVGA